MAVSPNSVNFVTKDQSECVWWSSRTTLEKGLICCWATLSLLFFFLCITIITIASIRHKSVGNSTVCLTKQCLNEASRIMDYLDESTRPCSNFYQFACGKWLNTAIIPDKSNSISSFSITQEKIFWKLRSLLKEPINKISDFQTVKNLKNMYKSCMNLTLIKELGSQPLLKYLKLLGGWPVLDGDSWNETQFDLIKLFSNIRSFGFKHEFLFNLRVAPNLKRNTINNIYILEPVFSCLTKNQLIYENKQFKQFYSEFMVEVAVMLGADEDRTQQELYQVIQLESMIAKAFINPGIYEFIKVHELEAITPIKWTNLLNGILLIKPEINENETLVILGVNNFKTLNQIITDYVNKNKRTLANFVIWKVVFQSIRGLDQEFETIIHDFYLQTRPLKRSTKRWTTCLNMIGNNMKTGLTSLYLIHDKQKEQKKQLANQIFESIRSSMYEKFDRIDWLDESTRLNAKYKIKTINKFIGYSDQLLDSNTIDQFHIKLEELDEGNFFENLLRLQKWNLDLEYSPLKKLNDRNDWQKVVTAPLVNAYYSRHINGIKIPIWILQGIFLGVKRPNYLNYGSLGWIIGHELVHPFDSIGGRFDNRGNLRDWWDADTKELFENKSQCFIKQYQDHYPKMNPKSTLSENIADNGGIESAFQVYKKFTEQNGKELLLPGINYSQDQLFWISAAQVWCTKMSRIAYKNFLDNSIHSLSENRVQISFSNSIEFSKTFGCSETDPMNPKHKCNVW